MCAYYNTRTHIKVTFARSLVARARFAHFFFGVSVPQREKNVLKNNTEANEERQKKNLQTYYCFLFIKTNK